MLLLGVMWMNNSEFDRLEKVLIGILEELRIQNKLRALEMERLVLSDKKAIECTLKGYDLKTIHYNEEDPF